MIIVMKNNADETSVKNIISQVEGKGLKTHLSQGEEVLIIGVVGDKSKLDTAAISNNPMVEKIVPITESYKLSNRKFHPEPMSFSVGNTFIGPNNVTIMSGPCAVETEEQLLSIARAVKKSGATILRGGAYKPRTSPYSFQGLEVEGLKYMQTASQETGLATICEVTSAHAVESAERYVSMLQVGARNMQNFELLKEVGRTGMPVLLKRGLAATIDEWLNAAEYIMAAGNSKVALCERGIRTFETATRNTLDLSAVCVLKEKTHLPVIVDPSHATGVRDYVEPLAKAAIACGADGLMIEVHNDPAHALSDGPQSLNFQQFDSVMQSLKPYIALSGRTL
ncbi:MAG: 3-deoxy-7-phosphoheptulonate synthase [Lachnospiraceae bacterium]|nr:3-deoxy-7-phosphoheptulonate synthase [Lachnospiraceae bacterium]MDD7377758.1 3-deoxy-7-phosphoheptulonate synthase [Lachnospiraceae bacterium]MDY4616181.1 3-deoxy-7-phosphoheptulonate synthase [Lachnospiraceae bacterium]